MSDNAKLRRLRAFVVERERRYHESLTRADLQEFVGEMGVTWRQRANEDALILSEIDRLLAEPEPQMPACGSCRAPLGECVSLASADGSWCPRGCFAATGKHSWRNARGVLAPPRRETLEQEIARLFTHEATP